MSDVVVWSAGMVIPITAPSILDGAVAVRDGRIEHVGARDWVVETLTQCGLSSVSYTHLDVYKRQALNCSSSFSLSGCFPRYLYWKKEVLALGPKSLSNQGA